MNEKHPADTPIRPEAALSPEAAISRDAVVIGPESAPAWLAESVERGGGRVVDGSDASVLLWAAPNDPDGLAAVLAAHGEHIEWVQLPWAGVEPYADLLDSARSWTCGKGVYSEPVAEMALALALAGLRGIGHYARSTSWREYGSIGTNLQGANVTLVGGGGIAQSLARLLKPFEVNLTVVRRSTEPFEGASRTVGLDLLDDSLERAAVVVVACALTDQTIGLFDAQRFEAMSNDAWLVNVARGAHVVTSDLVDALRTGAIAGAALDVTDPEPLPEGHPLWSLPNCIITPHVGNTAEMAQPLLTARITDNVRRWIAHEELIGRIDTLAGY